MRAVLTVIGKDKVGIVAGVSQSLATLNINIVDMTQTIMQDYFTMMMILDMDKQTSFDYIRQELDKTGQQLDVKISIQNEEIFNAMHKLG